jgi:DNA-binding NtrC family response regulator
MPLGARAGRYRLVDRGCGGEREYGGTVLRRHGGNATRAAQKLGISRQMLRGKIKRYRLRSGGLSASPPD